MANEIHNITPCVGQVISPLELFMNSDVKPSLRYDHHFGCPVYILQSHLQGGQKGWKWEDRARVGIYLGPSPQHARTVALVLSLTTGLVSPQFHCSYDDLFETTTSKQAPFLLKSLWQCKTYFEAPTPIHEGDIKTELASGSSTPTPISLSKEVSLVPLPTHTLTHEQDAMSEQQNLNNSQQSEELAPHSTVMLQQEQTVDSHLRRSHQCHHLPKALHEYVLYEALAPGPADLSMWTHPLSYKASADLDMMYLHEALRPPDKEQFLKAMEEEVNAHQEGGHWDMVE